MQGVDLFFKEMVNMVGIKWHRSTFVVPEQWDLRE